MVAYLGCAEPGLYVRADAISRRIGFSVSTVGYHARKLAGVVESRKGPDGGYRLRLRRGPRLRTRPDLSRLRAVWR